MELMNPIAIVICAILSLALAFIHFKKKVKYTNGKKVANTKYIKETQYYQTKVKKYKMFSNLIKGVSVACIIITSILIARPVTVQTQSEDKYNRDIILGLDVSDSVLEADLEFIKKFQEIVPNIKGDRIGIVIFNTSPVVYCPLTDDYDYIDECLNKIKKQLEIELNNTNLVDEFIQTGDIDSYLNNQDKEKDDSFFLGGVLANNKEKGSSIIGDGLAGSIFSFPDLKTNKERTRIILFATDNVLYGKETVTLSEACKLCKQYNINLYAYCATSTSTASYNVDTDTISKKAQEYKNAVEKDADGKFYIGDLEKMSSNVVNEIKETKTSLLKSSKKTYVIDHPTIPFIIIIILFFTLIVIEKRIKI